jgi:hypothetical protein
MVDIWEYPEDALQIVELLKSIFDFFSNPLNAIPLAYSKGLKERMIGMISSWMDDDLDICDYLFDGGIELRTLAGNARDIIKAQPFIRHVY